MDSLTQPEITNPARAVSVALTNLLDFIDSDPAPEFTLLRDKAYWSLSARSGRLTGSMYAHDSRRDGLKLLEAWQEKLGGTVEPTTEKYSDGIVYYALTTEIDRVPVVLKMPVEKPDIEQQLRDRIAELEAALQRGTEGGEAR